MVIGLIAMVIATILLGGFMGVHTLRSISKSSRKVLGEERVFQGYCPACGYDLAGVEQVGERCPECGHVYEEAERRRLNRIAPYLLRARQDDR